MIFINQNQKFMKKIFMLLTLMVGISISVWSNDAAKQSSEHLTSKKVLDYSKILMLPWGWYSTEVTFYLSCGLQWEGNVTQWTNHYGLTSAEFAAAWRLKNFALCGVWVAD
jgi:hypothetical protein